MTLIGARELAPKVDLWSIKKRVMVICSAFTTVLSFF